MRLSSLEHDLKRKKSSSEARKYVDHSVVIHTHTHTHTLSLSLSLSLNTYWAFKRNIRVFNLLPNRDQSPLRIHFFPYLP